jgi:ubiquinone/menaquinone biosynthesis C-methylase UbiE
MHRTLPYDDRELETIDEGVRVSEETYALSAQAAEFYESTFVPALFREWAGRLVDFAGIAHGQSVLDVACGTGAVTRAAAERVGAEGVVTGLDVNPAMLDVARRVRPDLDWREGDATALPFQDAAFDHVLSQAALMFFGDRVAALREMGRVAGTDGKVTLQVPGRLANSAGYVALTEVASRHAGPKVLDLLGGYFAVGEPELLESLCTAAGLQVDRIESWVGATRLDSIDTFLSVELLPLAEAVDADVRERIASDCRTALAPFIDGSGAIAAPIEVQLVAARLK